MQNPKKKKHQRLTTTGRQWLELLMKGLPSYLEIVLHIILILSISTAYLVGRSCKWSRESILSIPPIDPLESISRCRADIGRWDVLRPSQVENDHLAIARKLHGNYIPDPYHPDATQNVMELWQKGVIYCTLITP